MSSLFFLGIFRTGLVPRISPLAAPCPRQMGRPQRCGVEASSMAEFMAGDGVMVVGQLMVVPAVGGRVHP